MKNKDNKISDNSIKNCLRSFEKNLKNGNTLLSLLRNWELYVGNDLKNNCIPLSLNSGILTIGASHPLWRQALTYNKHLIKKTLNTEGFLIKDIIIKQYHFQTKNNKEKNINSDTHPSFIDERGFVKCQICNKPSPTGELELWGKCILCRRKDLSKNL